MTIAMSVFGGSSSESDLLAGLPTYQRIVVEELLMTRSPDEAAQAWLENLGQANTAAFGAAADNAERLFKNLLIEMQKFFCTDDGYVSEREEVGKAIATGRMLTVGTLSTILAPHLGMATAVIGPGLVLVLILVARASNATLCEVLDEKIKEFSRDPAPPDIS